MVGNRIIFSDSSFYESFTEVNWVFESIELQMTESVTLNVHNSICSQ